MVTITSGKGPGPSGAARVGGHGPGGGKAGIKAVSAKQSVSALGKATGKMMAIPDKAAPGGAPKGMKTVSNLKKI